jgi:hypothetical protein
VVPGITGLAVAWTCGAIRTAQWPTPARSRRETMAKGQKKSNKEIRKPKAEKVKKNAANPSTKGLIKDANR